jgi:hypothetical protein
MNTKRYKLAEKPLAKAHTQDSMKAVGKLTAMVDGRRIISDPPMIVPIEQIFADVQADVIYQLLHTVLAPAYPAVGSPPPARAPWPRWPARSSGSAASAPAPGSC